jgi:hypothetical protein
MFNLDGAFMLHEAAYLLLMPGHRDGGNRNGGGLLRLSLSSAMMVSKGVLPSQALPKLVTIAAT